MNPFFVILKKELRAVAQERTILIAITIQLFIASFSSAILIGLMSFYDPEAIGLSTRISVRTGIVGATNNPLVGFLEEQNAQLTSFATLQEAQLAFDAGQIDAAILIPPERAAEDDPTVEMQLVLPASETYSTVILMVLQGPLKEYETYLRKRNGIQIRYTDVAGKPATTYEFQYGVILPLLMFFPAFIAGSMVVDSISEELVNRTMDTLWVAPLSLNTILGSKIAAAVLLAGAQAALWAALLRFNSIPIQNLGLVLLLSVLSAAIIAIGSAFIAVYLKDRERSQFLYSIFVLLSASLSYLFDLSPIALVTRLATGDYYTGPAEVALYAGLLAVLMGAFFTTAEKLIAVPS
ncbi:MAG TPA: ABC transporter permease [Chloroflexi bacterium]|nr:ABC transporter permease [Chloroflexota bacterium]